MKASEGSDAPPAAWQPLTFGGVAAFAGARTARLFAFQLATALLAAVVVLWFLHRAYCPVVLQAIRKMPDTARLARGTLQGVPDTWIAESKFLAIAAKPQSGAEIGQGADLQIELRQNDFSVSSIFWPDWGLDYPYQSGATLSLARSNLEPWWSAWQPVFFAATGAATILLLLLGWAVLATIYMWPAKFIAWFADRQLTCVGSWKLASAALLPGALVLTGAMVLYGWGFIDLVGLTFFAAVHIILGWVYLLGGSLKAKDLAPADWKRNPFTA